MASRSMGHSSCTVFSFSITKTKIKNYFWCVCYSMETEDMNGKKTEKVEVKKLSVIDDSRNVQEVYFTILLKIRFQWCGKG